MGGGVERGKERDEEIMRECMGEFGEGREGEQGKGNIDKGILWY